MPDVRILPTGSANLRSVEVMLQAAGRTFSHVSSPADILSPTPLIVPGVGAFRPAMTMLNERGWAEPLRKRVATGLPTLCICLGMQLLLDGSDEASEVPGLGAAVGFARRFEGDLRVPQMGWNSVHDPLGSETYYFANSYRLAEPPPGWTAAYADYGGPFVAMMRRERIWACQFHPELSGVAGKRLLSAWLDGSPAPVAPATSPRGLAKRVIPCLDVRDGRIVKGVKFQGLRDVGDPVERAALYEHEGADEIVILDVSATPEGRATSLETVRRVREAIGIPLTVGGGVRTVADAQNLLEAGADKVALNSAAVRSPDLLKHLAGKFGSQCVVIAIDAKADGGGWRVVTHSGATTTPLDAVEWASKAEANGAGEVLLTSWDRDGTQTGYDLDLLASVAEATSIPIIASGGGANAQDMSSALDAGADAVLAATIFHDGRTSVQDLKRELADFNWSIRR